MKLHMEMIAASIPSSYKESQVDSTPHADNKTISEMLDEIQHLVAQYAVHQPAFVTRTLVSVGYNGGIGLNVEPSWHQIADSTTTTTRIEKNRPSMLPFNQDSKELYYSTRTSMFE